MKTVFYGTTALIFSANFGFAQGIEISGFAELGVYGGSGVDTQFFSDVDVDFTMSGVADNGLTFGARVNLDTEGGEDNFDTSPEVFLSGDFGTLTMGDTDGAFDWALTEVALGSRADDAARNHVGFDSNNGYDGYYDGAIARYEYSFGDFAFAVSAELSDNDNEDPIYATALRYAGEFGAIRVAAGLGYTENPNNDESKTGISLETSFNNGLNVIGNYTKLNGTSFDRDHYAVGLNYTRDRLTVGLNAGGYKFSDGYSECGVGLNASYDFGGGLKIHGSAGKSDSDFYDSDTRYTVGLTATF